MLVRRRTWGPRRSGAAVVEMAFVLPLFITLVIGQIETMRAGMVLQLLNVAARDACRTAVIPGASLAKVQDRLKDLLDGPGIDLYGKESFRYSISPSNWDSPTLPAGTGIEVVLSVNYGDVALLPVPRFFDRAAPLVASAVLSAERY